MDVELRPSARLVSILLVALLLVLLPIPASATVPQRAAESGLLQPPPPEAPSEPPPSGPPPGAGEAPSPEPSEPPSEPESAPSDADSPPPEPESDAPPPQPSAPPATREALPDPSAVEEGGAAAAPDGNQEPRAYAIVPISGLSVSIDRGCGAVYEEGDTIEFTVTGDWEVINAATDYWRYLEVWGSTNGAWWHQVIPGQWIGPRDSVYRRAWIARPVGDELLYARLLDRYGQVLAEATCEYISQEQSAPPPDQDYWIGCGETLGGYVGPGEQEEWLFAGRAGQRLTIRLYGEDGFDTYLKLYDPRGRLLRQHDDIGRYNTDSRISHTLPRNGTYTIVAHGYDYEGGSYRIAVSCW